MNAVPSGDVLLWTVLALNVAYLVLIADRVAANRKQRSTTLATPATPVDRVAQHRVVSNRAAVALIAVLITGSVYSVSFALWLLDFRGLLGPALIESSWMLYATGLVLS